jgi:pimeloyl-ACP methyl ester carboxylesterase
VNAVEHLIFLPGASGNTRFWEPAAARLAHPAARVFVGYPGFGGVPSDASVSGLHDLSARLAASLDRPSVLVAQSMGGVIAIAAALARPACVAGLVLTATSGGLDVVALGGVDWRAAFAAAHPGLPPWFAADRTRFGARLAELRVPVLLVWGDADPISPVATGEALKRALPHAELVVIPGGDHDVAMTHADLVATHILRFLRGGARADGP